MKEAVVTTLLELQDVHSSSQIVTTNIIIIIRSHRQQRSVASTQSGHDDEPWTIRDECWRVYRRRSAGSMNGAGPGPKPGPKREPVLAAATSDNVQWVGVCSSSLITWPTTYQHSAFYRPDALSFISPNQQCQSRVKNKEDKTEWLSEWVSKWVSGFGFQHI